MMRIAPVSTLLCTARMTSSERGPAFRPRTSSIDFANASLEALPSRVLAGSHPPRRSNPGMVDGESPQGPRPVPARARGCNPPPAPQPALDAGLLRNRGAVYAASADAQDAAPRLLRHRRTRRHRARLCHLARIAECRAGLTPAPTRAAGILFLNDGGDAAQIVREDLARELALEERDEKLDHAAREGLKAGKRDGLRHPVPLRHMTNDLLGRHSHQRPPAPAPAYGPTGTSAGQLSANCSSAAAPFANSPLPYSERPR